MPSDVSPRVEWLTVGGDPALWRSLGFVVTDDGLLPLHGASLRIAPPVDSSAGPAGLIAWSVCGLDVDAGAGAIAVTAVPPR